MSLYSAQSGKTVHLIPKDSAIKRLCFDDETQMLRPNLVLVDLQGSVVFEINELGLKGAARDPSRKLAVVWGDSVVFGIRWSWPCLLDELAPRYQFLNGGIEADPYDNILRRAAVFNRMQAVALNILMLGWHPIPPPHLDDWELGLGARLRGLAGKLTGRRPAPAPSRSADRGRYRQLRSDLVAFVQTTPNTVLVTMPTALNRKIVDRNLSSQFIRGTRETVFSFAGDVSYSLKLQRHLFDHIAERNAMVREVAREAGVRLVDLAAEFDTEELDDFREHFHDVLHLRPLAYPKAAAAIYGGIKDLL
jgi:hypothetical protein